MEIKYKDDMDNVLPEGEVRRQMKRLWKDTFHDSDEYINLIFDEYFDIDKVEYACVDDKIVSAMLAVEYSFRHADIIVKGWYLCGLASDPKVRRQGIMRRLIDNINRKATDQNIAYTFLIPADKGLQRYYADKRYIPAFYRLQNNYVAGHDFLNELPDNSSEEIYQIREELQAGIYSLDTTFDHNEEIIEFINEVERTSSSLSIIHSVRDIENIINENRISAGSIFLLRKNETIGAIAFGNIDDTKINITKILSINSTNQIVLLQLLAKKYANKNISYYTSPFSNHREGIIEKFYSGTGIKSTAVSTTDVTEEVYKIYAHPEVYGMLRIASVDKFIGLLNQSYPDYSFAQDNSNKNYITIYHNSAKGNARPNRLKIDDLAELVFRCPDADNYIMDAFGLQQIRGEIFLMLD